jgi:hypothetical protein
MRHDRLVRLAGLLVPLLACCGSYGQQIVTPPGAEPGRPIEGSTGGTYAPNQLSSEMSHLTPGVKVHLDPYGKRCVAVAAYSRTKTDFRKIFSGQAEANSGDQATSKTKLFEHVIAAQNHCSQTIRLKVCYYGSQTCVSLHVPPYGDQEASLGVAAGTPDFHYQYTEQF